MLKKQKIWLWIFAAMFLTPEVLFLFTPLSILSFANNLSETNIIAPIYYIINQQFFTDHPIFTFLFLIIEWVGVLGLLLVSIRDKKKVLYITLSIFLLWLSFLIVAAHILNGIRLVI